MESPGLVTRVQPDDITRCGVPASVLFLIPVSHLLLAVNCSVNLLIYCVCNNQFRRAIDPKGTAGRSTLKGENLNINL